MLFVNKMLEVDRVFLVDEKDMCSWVIVQEHIYEKL